MVCGLMLVVAVIGDLGLLFSLVLEGCVCVDLCLGCRDWSGFF